MFTVSGEEALQSVRKHAAWAHGVQAKAGDFWFYKFLMTR
jgi:hypothetical protein